MTNQYSDQQPADESQHSCPIMPGFILERQHPPVTCRCGAWVQSPRRGSVTCTKTLSSLASVDRPRAGHFYRATRRSQHVGRFASSRSTVCYLYAIQSHADHYHCKSCTCIIVIQDSWKLCVASSDAHVLFATKSHIIAIVMCCGVEAN